MSTVRVTKYHQKCYKVPHLCLISLHIPTLSQYLGTFCVIPVTFPPLHNMGTKNNGGTMKEAIERGHPLFL
jgi:hypothetical protein